jgi:hypothetical protein
MPTNRTPIHRRPTSHISYEAVEAWKRADFVALHRLLRLRPWESSPLPVEITRLGVSQNDTPENCGPEWDASMPKAIALQWQLLQIAGWPDAARAEYERLLREAKEHAAYCRERVVQLPSGEYGAGTDLASRRELLQDAMAEVKYRQQLLDGLAEVQQKWAIPSC